MATARGIWSSTHLRLSLVMAVLFALVSLVSLAATYLIVRDDTVQALQTTLEQEMAGFRALPNALDVATFVRSQSETASPQDRILSYILPGGFHVGNAALMERESGYAALSLVDGAAEISGLYFALSARVHGGQMTIALSAEPLQDLRDAFLSVFFYSLVPTVVAVVGIGLLLARRSLRRLNRIDETLDQLTSGDFAARVAPLSWGGDDLTQIGTRIDKMAAAQEQQISALRQISADIAHDLKTPIQRVSVLLARLQDRASLDDDAIELVKQANAETDGIVRTFQSLLQIAQIEGGAPRKRFETLDIGELARTFSEVYEPAAEETGHRLLCQVPEAPILVRGDKSLLGQVFANLIENALRHTPAGTTVTVGAVSMPDGVRVTVADTGPGIPVSERENVLRRLYRLESSRTTPGNGLGLSMVDAIVDLHEGRLALQDNAPGLLVAVTLPIQGPLSAGA